MPLNIFQKYLRTFLSPWASDHSNNFSIRNENCWSDFSNHPKLHFWPIRWKWRLRGVFSSFCQTEVGDSAWRCGLDYSTFWGAICRLGVDWKGCGLKNKPWILGKWDGFFLLLWGDFWRLWPWEIRWERPLWKAIFRSTQPTKKPTQNMETKNMAVRREVLEKTSLKHPMRFFVRSVESVSRMPCF